RPGANVRSHKLKEGSLYLSLPIEERGSWRRPGPNVRRQVSGQDATAGNGRYGIDLGKTTDLVEPTHCPEVKQGSTKTAARKTQGQAIVWHGMLLLSMFYAERGAVQCPEGETRSAS